MKKLILSAALASLAGAASSQTVIADSVYLGTSYANNVWYSLANDSVGAQPKNNWDLAFETATMPGVGILLNTAIGDRLYAYPKSDTSGWATVDTSGLSTWKPRFNSDKNWSFGAFNQTFNGFDVGWGGYDINTHIITGDSIFIVKLVNGSTTTWKKIIIQDLTAGTFHFKFADLNGANTVTQSASKGGYASKNLFYYNMTTNTYIDREPATANWDLWFGQYSDSVTTSQGNPSPVTGVLANTGVQLAKVYPVANKATYTDYASATFSDMINTIGYDWKPFVNGVYSIKDSTVYFVKSKDGSIWKLLFTGFGGSADGKIAFTKQRLLGASIPVVNGNTPATLAVYPNPAQGQNATLVYSFEQRLYNASVVVTDMAGRSVFTSQLESAAGLHTLQLPTAALPSGLYNITLNTAAGRVQQKLSVRN
jgi:hypothetical protein